MKKVFLFLSLLFVLGQSNAQIIKGDMNYDGKITIVDLSLLSNTLLGKASPENYNSLLAGTWRTFSGETFTLAEDGSATYEGAAATYFYNPYNPTILFYNPAKLLIGAYNIQAMGTDALTLQKCGEVPVKTYYRGASYFVTGITLSQSALSLSSGESTQLTATISPSTAVQQSVEWSSSNTGVATVDAFGNVKAIKGGTATITCTANDGSGVKAECKVTVKEADAHEYVDLGLSVKWATMNVGATEVAGSKKNSHTGQLDCYGEYYAWGETSPKDSYSWSNLKYCSDSNGNTFSKYVASSDFGTVDNKATLELTDDAASVNWGGSWRMPTYAEQRELRNNCYWEWTDSYNNSGVKGYIVYRVKNDSDKGKKNNTSSSSQTPTASYSLSDTHIFLPASGFRGVSSFSGVGSYGSFWSSSLYTSGSNCAYYFDFDSRGVSWYYFIVRYYGRPVRPVCP